MKTKDKPTNKESIMNGNIKVGKNQIYQDDDKSWVIEVFEYMDGDVLMYSTFDAVKSKEQAIALAKVVRRDNTLHHGNKLRLNPNYLLPEKDRTLEQHKARVNRIIKEVAELPNKKEYAGGGKFTDNAIRELSKYLNFMDEYWDW